MARGARNLEQGQSTEAELRALRQAFEVYTRTTEALEKSYRRLEERLRTLDHELQVKNQALELTTDYLNSILDSMTDGVIAVDVEGVITTCNRAAEAILGWPAKEAEGRSFEQVFGRPFHLGTGLRVCELEGRDGKAVPVSERNSPLADNKGERIGTVKVFQDLREIEALREQVRRKDRLAAIGEMAATVAHEIKNPLGGIRGFAALLQRDTPEDDQRYRLIEKILSGTKNLDRVVNELLEYTRPVELDIRQANLSELIEAAIGYLELDGNSVRISNMADPALTAPVDSGRMRQVLLNVLINALQSINETGEITVSAAPDGPHVLLAIRDTGCGIPPDQLDRVFSPFYTTKEKGTGLGLAVASKIVESHGGFMEVESEVGRGTEFRIRLPRGD